jgi:Domain of unknown function (DUF4190)
LVTIDSGNLIPMTQSRTAQSTGVNALAIVALIFAFVFAPLGIVLGHVARRQINQTGQRGGGIATAALVIGYLALALGLVLAGVAAFGGGGGANPGGGGGY